jgi:hypothetical protein
MARASTLNMSGLPARSACFHMPPATWPVLGKKSPTLVTMPPQPMSPKSYHCRRSFADGRLPGMRCRWPATRIVFGMQPSWPSA